MSNHFQVVSDKCKVWQQKWSLHMEPIRGYNNYGTNIYEGEYNIVKPIV